MGVVTIYSHGHHCLTTIPPPIVCCSRFPSVDPCGITSNSISPNCLHSLCSSALYIFPHITSHAFLILRIHLSKATASNSDFFTSSPAQPLPISLIEMSAIRAIFTSWFSSAPSQHGIDIEAQTIASVPLPTQSPLSSPAPVHLNAPQVQSSHSQEEGTTNAIDDFFGVTYTRRSGSQNSRRENATRSPESSPQLQAGEEIAPPPYAEASDLPSYAAVADPPTLAMYLFKFGFCELSPSSCLIPD